MSGSFTFLRKSVFFTSHGLLLSILLLAAGVRIIHLGTYPFWADEVHNLLCSEDLYGIFFEGHFAANHPPLPYVLLAGWRAIGMDGSEWALRGLPALFGVLGVAAIYWTGAILFDRKVGMLAALLLALSPYHLVHSQDLKEYIYLPFFGTLMVGFFYRAATGNRRRDWLCYGLFAGISCYAETFVAPLLVAINLWFLCCFARERSRLLPWFLANMLGALMFLPWLGLMLQKVYKYMIASEFWVPPPTPWSVLFYFKTIAFGYSDAKPFFYLAVLVFAVLTAWGCWTVWTRYRHSAFLITMWAVFPVALVYALSFISQSIFLIRALIPYSIAVYLLAAVGAAHLRPPLLRPLALAATLLLSVIGITAHYQRNLSPTQFPHRPGIHVPREDPLAARYILDRFEEGDIVIHGGMGAWLPFYWYGFRDRPQYFGGINAEFIRRMYAGNPINTDDEALVRLWPKLIDELVPGHRRIWYVLAEWGRDYRAGNAAGVWRWLDSRYVEVDHAIFKDLDVLLYVTPEHPDAPRALARVRDDLVSADYRYSDRETPYRKVKPDIGLTATPVAMRRGPLELRFAGPSVAANGRREISVEVVNGSSSERRVNLELMASDLLFRCAALDRTHPEGNTWHFDLRHRAEPGHVPYDLWTLTGNLALGADPMGGRISLPAGEYIPWLYAVAPVNRPEFLTAPMSLHLNGEAVFSPMLEEGTPARWTWIPGRPVTLTGDEAVEVEVLVRPLEGLHPGYANLGYLAFVAADRAADTPLQTASDLSIPPGETRTLGFTIPEGTPRVDIWVYDQAPDGQGYHIFEHFKEAGK